MEKEIREHKEYFKTATIDELINIFRNSNSKFNKLHSMFELGKRFNIIYLDEDKNKCCNKKELYKKISEYESANKVYCDNL